MLVTRVRPGLAKSRRRAIEEEDERFNPISPLTGNMVMRGGGMPMDPPGSSRNPRHRMADSRAVEIQMRNQTPGTGATPTMGVSQLRGGAMGRCVGGAMNRYVGSGPCQSKPAAKRGRRSAVVAPGPLPVQPEKEAEARPVDVVEVKPKKGKGRMYGCGATPSMGLSEFRGGAHSMDDDFWNFLSSLPATKLKKAISILNREEKSYDPDDFYTIRFSKGASKEDMLSACEGADPRKGAMDRVRAEFPVKEPKAKKEKKVKGGSALGMLLDRTNVSKSGPYEGQGMLRKKSQPALEFSSNMKGGRKHHMNGGALSAHLLSEMGAPSHKALLRGMMEHAKSVHGAGFFDSIRGAFEDFGRKVKNEFVNPDSVLRGQVLPKAAQIAAAAAPLVNMARPGLGTALATGAQSAQGANAAAKSVGLGRRKRAPASAGDGRRKRADIVRKVMNERGISMIEASKVVKSEGLY